jgi:hypothetical protein
MAWSRLSDYIFAAFFATFVFICVIVEVPVCLGEIVSPDSSLYFIRQSYDWGLLADTIWIQQPTWSRTAVCFHCFGFGPLYALLCLTFLFRWNFMQQVGIAVGAAKLYAGAVSSLVSVSPS